MNLYSGYLNYEAAEGELNLARKGLPNDARIFELRGLINNRQGKFEEALPELERAMQLDPRDVYRLEQIAQTYFYLRRYPEAISVFDRALAIEPNNVELRVYHAYIEASWKGDPRALHEVIASIRATNPGVAQQFADMWLFCALADRDVVAARAALLAAGETTLLSVHAVHFNHLFVEGIIARLEGDEQKARAALEAARAEQEKIVQRNQTTHLRCAFSGWSTLP